MPFQKGHKLATGRPLGSLNRETLTKLERREVFDKQITQKWEEIISNLRPEYIADQYLGKAPDKIEVTADVKINLPDDKIAQINDIALND